MSTLKILFATSLTGAFLFTAAAPVQASSGKMPAVCGAITAEQAKINKQEEAVRLRIQAQPRPEGSNVKTVRELIALMPSAYAGAKGQQALAQAKLMDDADAFIDADKPRAGQALSADQKQIKALEARYDALQRQFNSNPDCVDR